jgi:hypothetical protein
MESALLPPSENSGIPGEVCVSLFGLHRVLGLQTPPSPGFVLSLRIYLGDGDSALPCQVQGCLYAGPQTLYKGPQVDHVTVAPTAVAEVPAFGVDVEARVLILVVRMRTAPDVGLPGGPQIGVAAGEPDEVDLCS